MADTNAGMKSEQFVDLEKVQKEIDGSMGYDEYSESQAPVPPGWDPMAFRYQKPGKFSSVHPPCYPRGWILNPFPKDMPKDFSVPPPMPVAGGID